MPNKRKDRADYYAVTPLAITSGEALYKSVNLIVVAT